VGTVENGRRWCSGGGGGGGWWWVWVYFGFREKMTEVGLGNAVRPKGKMGERGGGGKCDLKAGHKRHETEYVRMYRSTFDRTRACAWCVCA
jgi:Na+/alanine symporter